MKTELEPNTTQTTSPGLQRPASWRRRLAVVTIIALILGSGLAAGILPRLKAQSQRAALSREAPPRTVNVTNVSRLPSSIQLLLPGDVRAFEQTKIYARADGYLLKWNIDIGGKASAGQVLAEIDTPELDQELNQARAALAQAQANLALARSSAERWEGLLKERAVSQQEVDERTGALAARAADANAAEAAVRRLEKLTSFKEVRAPFAGTITRRFVDTGALIRAGGNASALFELARMDTLRIHVNVPQAYLRDVATGASVTLRVAEYPERVFTGTILRTSGAFDAATRTLLTEIEAANHDGALFAGMHIVVQFALASSHPPIVVPATAVMTRSDGLHVATVDDSSSISLQKVQVGRDLGRSMEILSGLSEGARVVTNPTDTLAQGMTVKVANAPVAGSGAKQLVRR